MRARWLLLLPAVVCGFQRAPDARAVQALAEIGKVDEAIELARAGGPPRSAALGDVLVMRGRLVAADSALQYAVAHKTPGWRGADATLAELAETHGDHAEATRRATALVALYTQGASGWTTDDHVAAGRAYLLMSRGNANATRSALAAFDAAYDADPTNLDARLRAGELFLDKYNAPEA
jgi:hypothetical protein